MADIKISIFVKFLASEQKISSFCFSNLVVLHWEDVLDSEILKQINIQHTFTSHSKQFFLFTVLSWSRISGIQQSSTTDKQQRCQPNLMTNTLGAKTKQNGAFQTPRKKVKSLCSQDSALCTSVRAEITRKGEKFNRHTADSVGKMFPYPSPAYLPTNHLLHHPATAWYKASISQSSI